MLTEKEKEKEYEYAKLVKLSSDLLIVKQTEEQILSSRKKLDELKKKKTSFKVERKTAPPQYKYQETLDKEIFSEFDAIVYKKNSRRSNPLCS